jgi:hypothetical protein
MESNGTDLVTEVVRLVFALVAPVLSALLVALAAKALQKLGLTLDAEKQAKLEHLAAGLVARTEEWASSRIKAGMPVTAREKAEYYLTIATDALPGVSADEAHALAQTTLGRLRLGMTAVLQDIRQAATSGGK